MRCLIMVSIIISQLLSISFSSRLPSLCVQESSLNLDLIHLVSESHLAQKTVPGCMAHCLTRPGNPGPISHVLVSYSHGILGLFGDQFNCICAREGAVSYDQHIGDAQCMVTCPEGDHMCGDSSNDLMR